MKPAVTRASDRQFCEAFTLIELLAAISMFLVQTDWHVSAVDTDFLKTTEGFNKHFRGSP